MEALDQGTTLRKVRLRQKNISMEKLPQDFLLVRELQKNSGVVTWFFEIR